MLAPNQLIEVHVVGRTLKHYRDLGYDTKVHDIIMVPPKHLPALSKAKLLVVCDACGKEYFKYNNNYVKQRTYDMDVCKSCSAIKRKMTNKTKYGVEWAIQNDEIKTRARHTCIEKYGVEYNTLSTEAREKARATMLKNYGVESPAQNEEIKKKMQQTSIDRYGFANPMQNPEIQEKSKQAVFDKYGVYNAFASKEIQQKIKQYYLENYGVEHPSQVPEIHEKMMRSLTDNGTGKASKPQKQLYDIVANKYPDATLNHPFGMYSLDIFICVDGVDIDIEYDGWYWHQNKASDVKRDKFLQSYGMKTLRIRSGTLLPSEQELFDAIGFLVNTEYRFKEIVLSDWHERGEEECRERLQVAL